MRKNHVVKSVVCLLLVFAFALLAPAAVSRPARAEEEEWFESWPSSACFDKLWVGDTVYFANQWYYDGYDSRDGLDMKIVSGSNVQSDMVFDLDTPEEVLRFTKPGKAQVKVKETHESGESREQTFSFTVTERPKDKPEKVVVHRPMGNLKMKIGERIQDIAGFDIDEWWFQNVDATQIFHEYYATVENANYGIYDRLRFGYYELHSVANKNFLSTAGGWIGGVGGGGYSLVSDNRVAGWHPYEYIWLSFFLNNSLAFKPGKVPVDIYMQKDYMSDDLGVKVGTLGSVTVEEPVIKTNAPAAVKVGSTLNFTTSLTNTALKSLKTAQYEDEKNYSDLSGDFGEGQSSEKHEKWFKSLSEDYYDFTKSELENVNPVAYKPSVTVIEGKDCVSQSKQDYGNTLSSSETLTFKKTGTVKLKVTYNQFATSPRMLTHGHYEDTHNDAYWHESDIIWYDEDIRYNPTATVTIQVTEDGKSASGGQTGAQSGKPSGGASSESPSLPPIESKDLVLEDSETGITVGADEGVIPSGSVLTAKPSDYVLKDPAGKFAAFDLTLENGGVAVQPNGKVQVAIPIPDGFDKNRLTVYRVEESDDLTELPCAVDGDTVTFEADHFSVYVIAETEKQTVAAVAKAGRRSPLPWILGGAGVLLAAGCAFLLWRLKFRKREPKEE